MLRKQKKDQDILRAKINSLETKQEDEDSGKIEKIKS